MRDLDVSIEKFIVSAVVNERLIIDTFFAKTLKQSRFYFCKKYGYKIRDFKRLNSGGPA